MITQLIQNLDSHLIGERKTAFSELLTIDLSSLIDAIYAFDFTAKNNILRRNLIRKYITNNLNTDSFLDYMQSATSKSEIFQEEYLKLCILFDDIMSLNINRLILEYVITQYLKNNVIVIDYSNINYLINIPNMDFNSTHTLKITILSLLFHSKYSDAKLWDVINNIVEKYRVSDDIKLLSKLFRSNGNLISYDEELMLYVVESVCYNENYDALTNWISDVRIRYSADVIRLACDFAEYNITNSDKYFNNIVSIALSNTNLEHDWLINSRAIYYLSLIGNDPAIKALIEIFNSDSVYNKKWVIKAFCNIKNDMRIAELLIKNLKCEYTWDNILIMETLLDLGSSALIALPYLNHILIEACKRNLNAEFVKLIEDVIFCIEIKNA